MSKQVVERYNVSVPKNYTTSQGEVKTQWINIGNAVRFDDGSIAQNINALPTGNWWDGTCQLFRQEQRQQQAQPQQGGFSQQPPLPGCQQMAPPYEAHPAQAQPQAVPNAEPMPF